MLLLRVPYPCRVNNHDMFIKWPVVYLPDLESQIVFRDALEKTRGHSMIKGEYKRLFCTTLRSQFAKLRTRCNGIHIVIPGF